MGYYCDDPGYSSPEEIFIEDYVVKAEMRDDKIAEVKALYPDLDENDFWTKFDECMAEEALQLWNERGL